MLLLRLDSSSRFDRTVDGKTGIEHGVEKTGVTFDLDE
jgi:hypothetical protein